MSITIDTMNAMDFDIFVEMFGNIMEHCYLITAALWTKRPFRSVSHILDQIDEVIRELPDSGIFLHDSYRKTGEIISLPSFKFALESFVFIRILQEDLPMKGD